jgi:hypothetical protein
MYKNFHNQHYLQPPVVVPLLVGIVHHNIIPFMLLSAVHTTCGCSGAVNHGRNAGLRTILTCSWCVANFGFEKMCQGTTQCGEDLRGRFAPGQHARRARQPGLGDTFGLGRGKHAQHRAVFLLQRSARPVRVPAPPSHEGPRTHRCGWAPVGSPRSSPPSLTCMAGTRINRVV